MICFELTKTTNKQFKELEEEKCNLTYNGAFAEIEFKNKKEVIWTSFILKIEVQQESKNVYIKTKNGEYFLERIE